MQDHIDASGPRPLFGQIRGPHFTCSLHRVVERQTESQLSFSFFFKEFSLPPSPLVKLFGAVSNDDRVFQALFHDDT